jgi:CDP-glycerol glycerophosphotransferase (TagB/SpsB family)
MKKVLRKIEPIFSFINKFIPKHEHRIVFYSNLGFRDNVRAVYDYIIANGYNKKYQIVCSTNEYKKYKNLNIKNVCFVSIYMGVFYFLTSKYFFYSFGKYPIKPSKKQIVINLWHSTTFKKIGNLEPGNTIDYNFFTCVLASSELFADIMQKAFNCKKEQIIIAGHARNDVLFLNNDKSIKRGFNKMIFWLPTYRYDNREKQKKITIPDVLPLIKYESQLNQINDLLKSKNLFLLIKLHPLQNLDIFNSLNFSNLKIYTHKQFTNQNLDLYKIVSVSDALITDYSSIFFDFLLLDRPMAFDIADIKQYIDTRGLIFDNPLDYMPGIKLRSIDNLFEFLANISENKDEYKDQRKKINDLVNKYKNGTSSKYIVDFAGITK